MQYTEAPSFPSERNECVCQACLLLGRASHHMYVWAMVHCEIAPVDSFLIASVKRMGMGYIKQILCRLAHCGKQSKGTGQSPFR